MRIEITEHQLHHEQLRYLQAKDGFWGYCNRFQRITRTEKLAAVAVFSLYREGVGVSGSHFGRLARIVANELRRRGVTQIEVTPSRFHYCVDKAYRIDEWVTGHSRFSLVTQTELIAI